MDIWIFLSEYGKYLLLIAVVCFLLLFFRKKKVSIRGNTLFLIGDNGSGKTSLLYLLATKREISTVSSLEPIETRIDLNVGGNLRTVPVVDVPGHNHTREVFFKRIKDAKILVFMIDATNPESWARSAEYLYRLMINKNYCDMEVPTLLVMNKQDDPKAKKSTEIEEALIKEIERIKLSRRAISDDSEETVDYLKGDENKFSFEGRNFEFCEASVKNMEISEVESFIRAYF